MESPSPPGAAQAASTAGRTGPTPIPEPMLRAVVERAPIAMLLAGEDGRIVLANREAEALFGYPQQELVGLGIEALVPEEQRAGHPALRAAYVDLPVARPMGAGRMLHARCADGTLVPVEIALNPIRDGDRMLVLGVIVDLRARRRLERRFEHAVEASPTAMLMADSCGRIVLVNRETERLFGYPRLELLGRAVDALVPPRYRDHHPALRAGFGAQPEVRPMGAGRELYGLRRDGSEVPIEIGLTPIHTEEGPMVLAAIVDLSAHRRLTEVERANEVLEERVRQRTAMLEGQREELLRAVHALEQSNIELKQFAYVASHDLQSPLRAISGYLELLERRGGAVLDDTLRGWLHAATEAAQRMSNLIRDVLEYSRVDSRATAFEEVDLGAATADAMRLLDASIADADAVVEATALPVVYGDRAQLVQVLQNLIGNAIKYRGPARPRVMLTAADLGREWAVSVHDNGIGIPEESREKVFEIFRRLNAAKGVPGTGIGLAVCRRVVHRHGGEIRAGARPGGGTVMTFTLPKR